MSGPVILGLGIDAAFALWVAVMIFKAARQRARWGENYDFSRNVCTYLGAGALLMLIPWLVLFAVRAVTRIL